MTKPVLNLADAPVHTGSHGEPFSYSLRALRAPLGAMDPDSRFLLEDVSKHRVGYRDGEDGEHVTAVVQSAR